jgi:hypothetical protein
MPTMQRHGVKLLVLKIFELLPQESEPYLTIQYQWKGKWRRVRGQMWNFVGLLSTSVHSNLSLWLHVTIYWNQDELLLAFAKFGNSHLQEQLGDWSLVQY